MSERHEFKATVATDKARLVDNTLYFPGWTLYDNGENRTASVQYQDPEFRGLITFELEKGKHDIGLIFQNTKVRRFAALVSLVSLLLLLFPINIFSVKMKIRYDEN